MPHWFYLDRCIFLINLFLLRDCQVWVLAIWVWSQEPYQGCRDLCKSPRFISASGLSGLSSRDLSVESRAWSGCRGLCRCSRFIWYAAHDWSISQALWLTSAATRFIWVSQSTLDCWWLVRNSDRLRCCFIKSYCFRIVLESIENISYIFDDLRVFVVELMAWLSTVELSSDPGREKICLCTSRQWVVACSGEAVDKPLGIPDGVSRYSSEWSVDPLSSIALAYLWIYAHWGCFTHPLGHFSS